MKGTNILEKLKKAEVNEEYHKKKSKELRKENKKLRKENAELKKNLDSF